MKIKTSLILVFFIMVVFVFSVVLSACGSRIDVAATQTAAVTDTPVPTATMTSTATPTFTPTLTATPTEISTNTPTLTATITLTPTWQPIPGMIWPRATFTAEDVWWGGDAWCPARGQNVSCEIEYRDYSGVCLVGMTCTDTCGKYYGVDTIKGATGPYTFRGPCY